jgi:hypothetical protein
MENKNKLKIISNVEKSISEFCISNLEENIDIVLSQHRVPIKNTTHYLLVDNIERKACEIENNELHQRKLHD